MNTFQSMSKASINAEIVADRIAACEADIDAVVEFCANHNDVNALTGWTNTLSDSEFERHNGNQYRYIYQTWTHNEFGAEIDITFTIENGLKIDAEIMDIRRPY